MIGGVVKIAVVFGLVFGGGIWWSKYLQRSSKEERNVFNSFSYSQKVISFVLFIML